MDRFYRCLIASALKFAISSLNYMKLNPSSFVEFCCNRNVNPQIAIDKCVAETALFALLADRLRLRPELIKRLVAEMAPLVGTDVHRSLLRANPASAAGLALSHHCLKLLGVERPDFERLLKKCLSESTGVERPIFREMEQEWLRSLTDDAGPPDCADWIARSVSGSDMSQEWDDATSYAFTHEVFYLTDFGKYRFPGALKSKQLIERVDHAIAAQFGFNNLDLLAELGMARCMIGAPPSMAAELADALIVESWNSYGFLPSPDFDAIEHEKLDQRLAPFYFYFGVYHTTYVGALYFIAKLGLGGVSPKQTWRGRADSSNLAWVSRLRDGDAPILTKVLAGAPGDVEPTLLAAANARAKRSNDQARRIEQLQCENAKFAT